MTHETRLGILVANVGTPSAPTPRAVRAYLREFLSDPRVMDIPAPVRWFLLHAFILPRRPQRIAPLYQAHWTPEGSPLLAISRNLVAGLRERLPEAAVELGFRYGRPGIAEALDALLVGRPARIVVAPLFPQHASATTGSIIAEVQRCVAARQCKLPVTFLPPFHGEPAFLDAWATMAKPRLDAFAPDHVLLSYHSLPERQIRRDDPTGTHCLATPDCCASLNDGNRACYRAQCFATSRDLAARLHLPEGAFTTCFQSRFGRRIPWLGPQTVEVLAQRAQDGVKRVAVLCPSFVADSLETLHELDVEAREVFLEAGGAAFERTPCLNTHPAWIDALAALLRRV